MKKIVKAREFSSFLFLIALFAIVGIINPAFLSADNIIACFNESVVYIIISAGMAFAIFIGEIDVSVGANLGFVATVVSSMLRDGQNWAVAFITGIVIGALIGLFNGWGVAVMGVPSLIFTLGTNGVMRGMMYVYTGGAWVENLPPAFSHMYTATLVGSLSICFAVTAVCIIIIHLILKHTKHGKYFIAVGDNPSGATLVGIPALQTKIAAYVICGICAAIAGIVFSSRMVLM